MKTLSIYQRFSLSLFLIWVSVSCSGLQEDVSKTNTSEYTKTPYSLMIFTPTPRPTVTLRPSKTVTTTLTPTITISPTPSLTSLPTLGFSESKQMLNYMIYQNGGCELPCWWGITPGVTRRDDMINTLMTFVKTVFLENSIYVDSGGERTATRTIVYYNRKDTIGKNIFEVLSVEGVVKRIKIYEDLTGQFTLDRLLKMYGKPQQILLATEPASPNGTVPFSLILYYPEQGILADFFSEYGGRIQGNYVYVCPQNALPRLQLWEAGDSQQGEFEMKDQLSDIGYDYTKYKSIEIASELSIDKFYAIFQQKDNASCIATEAEKWW